MRHFKLLSVLALVLAIPVILSSCFNSPQTGDPQTDKALYSMKSVFSALPQKIGYHKVLKHWNFTLPTEEKFEWSKDTGANTADYAMVLLADPFIKAGLDPAKLMDPHWLYKPAEVEDGKQLPNRLIHPFNVSDKAQNSNGWEDSLRRVLKTNPSIVQFDETKKATTLRLGDGFSVQVVENPNAEDAEISFTIPSNALKKAGLEPEKLKSAGWSLEGNDILKKNYKLEYK